jgi:hypothetical protein
MSASGHCALRAPTAFSVRIKTIRTENAVMDKNRNGLALILFIIAILQQRKARFKSLRMATA